MDTCAVNNQYFFNNKKSQRVAKNGFCFVSFKNACEIVYSFSIHF